MTAWYITRTALSTTRTTCCCASRRAIPSFARNHGTQTGPRASDAYYQNNKGNTSGNEATKLSPKNLTPEQRKLLSSIIRVDQAGELAANTIYAGQYSVLKRSEKDEPLIAAMWEGEKRHLQTFNRLQHQHRTRPTFLWPVADKLGFLLGWSTAMMGREAAMACTEAVETVIGEHYDDQLKDLAEKMPKDEESMKLLAQILEEFRDDELEHLDTAVENDAHKAPAHALLSAAIAQGCNVAIKLCQKF